MSVQTSHRLFSSLIAKGSLTQEEIAYTKKAVYEIENLFSQIVTKKAVFNLVATERSAFFPPECAKELQRGLALFSQFSAQNEQKIANFFDEIKKELFDNATTWNHIRTKLGALLSLGEKELNVLVRAGQVVAGQVQLQKEASGEHVYRVEKITLPILLSTGDEFFKTTQKLYRIESPEETFILTGDLVRKEGIAKVAARQKFAKISLHVADVKSQTNGSLFVLVEGKFTYDTNTVAAFIAERFPKHVIADCISCYDESIAVELHPVEGASVPDVLETIVGSLGELTEIEAEIGAVTTHEAFSQNDVPDAGVGDLFLKHDRQNVGGDQYGVGDTDTAAPVQVNAPKKGDPREASIVSEDRECINCGKHTEELDEEGLCAKCRRHHQKAATTKVAVITGGPGSYHVRSEEGKNLGGPYKTREQAEKRLSQVEYFKHKGENTRVEGSERFEQWKRDKLKQTAPSSCTCSSGYDRYCPEHGAVDEGQRARADSTTENSCQKCGRLLKTASETRETECLNCTLAALE